MQAVRSREKFCNSLANYKKPEDNNLRRHLQESPKSRTANGDLEYEI
jgi:hypothetical protein